MDTFVFNIAKGRLVEYYNRVDSNDPANAALIIVPMASGGTEAQGQDLDTMAAVEADANFAEQTAGGWARITLTDTDLAALAVDDTNNRFPAAIPQKSCGSPTAGNNVVGFLICYDPDTTAGTDANLVPLTAHSLPITADGNEVILNAGDFVRAS